MRAFLAGMAIQVRLMRAYPDALIPFFTAPLFTVIFLTIFRHAGREDLTPYAAIAPVFIALWWLALFQSGWVITHERWSGTIELLVATRPISPRRSSAGSWRRLCSEWSRSSRRGSSRG
jgi:ABC-2 type transport system permease protein